MVENVNQCPPPQPTSPWAHPVVNRSENRQWRGLAGYWCLQEKNHWTGSSSFWFYLLEEAVKGSYTILEEPNDAQSRNGYTLMHLPLRKRGGGGIMPKPDRKALFWWFPCVTDQSDIWKCGVKLVQMVRTGAMFLWFQHKWEWSDVIWGMEDSYCFQEVPFKSNT